MHYFASVSWFYYPEHSDKVSITLTELIFDIYCSVSVVDGFTVPLHFYPKQICMDHVADSDIVVIEGFCATVVSKIF